MRSDLDHPSISRPLLSIIWPDLTAPKKHILSEINCENGVPNRDPTSRPEISHSIGLITRIVQLRWPAGVVPAQLPNFESEARRLRYQALGTACRVAEIPYLLVAHHEDDQAENVLLRLARGHNCLGLRGMKPVAFIPECWGIHGVDQSGLRERNAIMRARKPDLLQKQPSSSMPLGATIPFEDGGITIHRPLLEFSKDRLIATCQALGVRWVEDMTNRDPTQTPRNAVRYLLQDGEDGVLPRSLRKPSLLALRKRMCAKAEDRINQAKSAFELCEIIMLDTRAGVLVVRLPNRITPPLPVRPADRLNNEIEKEYKAAFLMRHLLDIVTSRPDIELRRFRFAIHSLFPDIKNPARTHLDKHLTPGSFCVGRVSFQRVQSPLQPSEESSSLDKDFVWVLNRSPLAKHENPIIEYNSDSLQPRSPMSRSGFQLWDTRYWIRVYNPTSFALRIQPLSLENLRQLRSSHNAKQNKSLNELLREVAPNKIRYTLPVLVQEQDGMEKVVALPTLGWVSPLSPLREKGVEWEVRYIKVTLPRMTDVPRVVI